MTESHGTGAWGRWARSGTRQLDQGCRRLGLVRVGSIGLVPTH
jgi:hypothetical protein